jgi:hypothetical protein
MKRGWLLAIIAANLLALIVLVFAYPHLMVSPGALVSGHTELATNCFACHAPLRGAAAERCISCHALPDIGVRSTKGVAVATGGAPKAAFHQQLADTDCMACHSDHAGPRLTKGSRKPFSHAVLRTEVRQRCESCHVAPANEIHRDLKLSCNQCHKADHWKPASFDHAALAAAVRDQCVTCHKAPVDTLHKQIAGNCKQCHSPQAWKPATFDHAKLFLLDKDHNATCETCHTGADYSRYTCYGCHEHSVAKVRSKHLKEGIQDFENCAKCHRSAKGESEGRESHRGRERD